MSYSNRNLKGWGLQSTNISNLSWPTLFFLSSCRLHLLLSHYAAFWYDFASFFLLCILSSGYSSICRAGIIYFHSICCAHHTDSREWHHKQQALHQAPLLWMEFENADNWSTSGSAKKLLMTTIFKWLSNESHIWIHIFFLFHHGNM